MDAILALVSGGGTMSVVMARPAVEALARRGIDPRPVLLAASIAPEAIATIENRLPAVNVRALWEEAAATAGDHAFGVHVAATAPPGTLDVIEYIFATSPDFLGGLNRLVRYVRVMLFPAAPVAVAALGEVAATGLDELAAWIEANASNPDLRAQVARLREGASVLRSSSQRGEPPARTAGPADARQLPSDPC